MTTENIEKNLLEEYVYARREKEALAKKLSEAEKTLDAAILKLHENMEARQATKTATYDGLGTYSMKEPRLIATVNDENQDKLLVYVRALDRGDLIKETIHWGTLSTFCKEIREQNQPLPEFINVYLKPSGIFYAAK